MNTNMIHKIAFVTDGTFRLTVATLLLLCIFAVTSGAVSCDLEGDVSLCSVSNLVEISGLPLLPVNGMTGHGNRPTSGILCINATSLLQNDNSGKRQRRILKDGPSTVKDAGSQNSSYSVCTATSLVNSKLGNQFRLVGAKPSGTS